MLMAGFFSLAPVAVPWIAGGNAELAAMGYTYMSISIVFSPLMFLVNLHAAAMRCEGKIKLMTGISLLVVALNVGFNYLLIVVLDMGVAGSAYGSAAAQGTSLAIITAFRFAGASRLRPRFHGVGHLWRNAIEMLSLGAPSSLGYMGVALTVGAVVYTERLWGGDTFEATVGAYGVVTRLMTFAYLPLMGLSLAFQAIAGNNFGAREMARTDASLRLAMLVAFVFCAGLQLFFFMGADVIGGWFVDDSAMIAELARILPVITLLFFVFGPLTIVTAFFQAIGDAARAAVLGLPRAYVFSLPLIFLMPYGFGEWGIWYAGPTTEALMLLLTTIVLLHNERRNGLRLGLFHHRSGALRV
jgi:Na+-driven multidrug efflux pump